MHPPAPPVSARRFTPTGVGTISVVGDPPRTPAVHPHGRGDNCLTEGGVTTVDGSPPRAWGQYILQVHAWQCARFTPTGVGTIAYDSGRLIVEAVHPHGRGDNPRSGRTYCDARGSPPRAWGQWAWAARQCGRVRFTPTGVGTMHTSNDREQPNNGSPPRAWGQCLAKSIVFDPIRFTPTGVGTIRSPPAAAAPRPVHPHGRGDNVRRCCACIERGGSPPRAWGQSVAPPDAGLLRRFTPTGVGTISYL